MNGANTKSKARRRKRGDSFKEFVLDQLSAMPGLSGRAMFGGYGLYHQEKFFCHHS